MDEKDKLIDEALYPKTSDDGEVEKVLNGFFAEPKIAERYEAEKKMRIRQAIKRTGRDNLEIILLDIERYCRKILKQPIPDQGKKAIERRNYEIVMNRKLNAQEIIKEIASLRIFLKESNTREAAYCAFKLGALSTILDIQPIRKGALKGVVLLDAPSKGGEARAEQHRGISVERDAIWQEDAEEIWRRRPRLPIVEVSKKLEEKYKAREYDNFPELRKKGTTIRRIIRKP